MFGKMLRLIHKYCADIKTKLHITETCQPATTSISAQIKSKINDQCQN